MAKKLIEIYTDGSAVMRRSEGFYEASSACDIYIDGVLVYEACKFYPGGTNSLGEVDSVVIALYKMRDIIEFNSIDPGDCDIILYSDSDYVVKSLTTYIKSWVRNGMDATWLSYKDKKPIAYQDKWKCIYSDFLFKKNPYQIDFYHIESHLDNDRSRKKAWFNFMKKNQFPIDFEDFLIHSKRNARVDELANNARINKIDFQERYDEDGEWGSTRNTSGVILISGRNTN